MFSVIFGCTVNILYTVKITRADTHWRADMVTSSIRCRFNCRITGLRPRKSVLGILSMKKGPLRRLIKPTVSQWYAGGPEDTWGWQVQSLVVFAQSGTKRELKIWFGSRFWSRPLFSLLPPGNSHIQTVWWSCRTVALSLCPGFLSSGNNWKLPLRQTATEPHAQAGLWCRDDPTGVCSGTGDKSHWAAACVTWCHKTFYHC